MESPTFLNDMAFVLVVACLATILFERLKQPVVLGYILAGLVVGPHFFPSLPVRDEENIRILAELGVVFLMFSVGLNFTFRKLRAVGTAALVAGVVQMAGMLALGFGVGKLFGWKPLDSIFLGAVVAISSTTIIVKALRDLGLSREGFAQLIFGILIVEDVAAILALALLSGFAASGEWNVAAIAGEAWRLGAFLTGVFVLGVLFVPRLLRGVARFRSSEMLLFAVLALCLGVSAIAQSLGYSVAMGAFLVGAVVAESREARHIEALTEPLRDLFGGVFFVSVGMMIAPHALKENMGLIAVVSLAVLLGKSTLSSLGCVVAGAEPRSSVRVGLGLAQIGEFSFIIASLGVSKGVTNPDLYPLVVAVSALTTFCTPYMIRAGDRVHTLLARVLPDAQARPASDAAAPRLGVGLLSNEYVKRGVAQLGLGALLLSGLFLVSVWGARAAAPWLAAHVPSWQAWGGAVVWAGVIGISLPLQLGLLRRVLRTAIAIREEGRRERPAFVPTLVMVLGLGTFVLLNVVFGEALLPSRTWVLALVAGFVFLALVVWKPAVDVYKRAQSSFESTLGRESHHEHHSVADVKAIPSLPVTTEVLTVVLEASSPFSGRLLQDTRLHETSGATIVCIEREGRAMVNPPADEVLYEGDRLYVLGRPDQLREALALLSEGE